MKINISRQNIFLLLMATILLVFVLVFSFTALIPKGKEYREQRTDLRKVETELKRNEDFNDRTFEELKKLQADDRHIIEAFNATFNAQRFEQQNKNYFNSLTLSKMSQSSDEDGFAVYEVNTTSQINSPKVFYDFLDAINKGDWIIGINFPIDFKREANLIRSSFTMKVYSVKPALKEEQVLIAVTEPEAEEKIKEAAIQEKTVVLVLEDIHFEFDKSTLSKEAKDTLKKDISLLNKNPKTRILVAGYASESGTEKYNQGLSEERAQSVKDYLVIEKLISADKISTIGYGETRPIQFEVNSSNTDSKAAKANMRVFLEITHK